MLIGSVWDCVGQTPLIRIESLSRATGCEIFGKAEFLNPGGSVKDRAAKGIIAAAEKSGQLKAGFSIYEGTAGNTGIGLATLAAERGYKCVLTLPDNQAEEKYEMLRALGAQLRLGPAVPFANPEHFFHRAQRLAEMDPQGFWANQFENPANGDFHCATTGPEIWEQTQGKIQAFVCSAGTGGTISGISRYLKSKDRAIEVVLADPFGSGLYCLLRNGKMETEGSSITEGIGIMRKTANFATAVVDRAARVSDQQMIEMLYHLAKNDGLVLGTSAALNVFAAYQIALERKNSGARIVTILCDHGTRYQSRIFNSTWLKSKGITPKALESV